MPAWRYTISGRVQGVGFRAFVVRVADKWGLRGEVWNRRDGGVELIAEHADAEILDRIQAELEHGPGHVNTIFVEEVIGRSFTGFEVGPTR